MSIRFNRQAAVDAITATNKYLTKRPEYNLEAIRALRARSFVSRGSGDRRMLAIELEKRDHFRIGPDKRNPILVNRLYVGKTALADDIIFLESLPETTRDNVAFLAPRVPLTIDAWPGTTRPQTLRFQVLLELDRPAIANRIRLVTPDQMAALYERQQIFNPRSLVSNL